MSGNHTEYITSKINVSRLNRMCAEIEKLMDADAAGNRKKSKQIEAQKTCSSLGCKQSKDM